MEVFIISNPGGLSDFRVGIRNKTHCDLNKYLLKANLQHSRDITPRAYEIVWG